MVEFDPGQPEMSALVLGIIYGATFCTLTCSPIIASYIIGQQQAEGQQRAMHEMLLTFNHHIIGRFGQRGPDDLLQRAVDERPQQERIAARQRRQGVRRGFDAQQLR